MKTMAIMKTMTTMMIMMTIAAVMTILTLFKPEGAKVTVFGPQKMALGVAKSKL